MLGGDFEGGNKQEKVFEQGLLGGMTAVRNFVQQVLKPIWSL